MIKEDHYRILGVSQTATEREIKRAYRKLSMRYHPDMPNGNNETYMRIREAYEVLVKNKPTCVQTTRDLTPFVYVDAAYINKIGNCVIHIVVHNIAHVTAYSAYSFRMDSRWNIGGGKRNGTIEIPKEMIMDCNYTIDLVFMPYEGRAIIENIKLKDPRSWLEKISYKIKKFLEI